MKPPLIFALLTVTAVCLFGLIAAQTRISMQPFVRVGMQVRDFRNGTNPVLQSEYPPPASALFYAFQENPFHRSFNDAWKIFMMLTLAGTCVWTFFRANKRAAALLPAALLVCIPLLGSELIFARYDILVTILLFLTWQAARTHRTHSAGIFIGLAASLKIVPILILPFLWLQSPREKRRDVLLGCISGGGIAIVLALLIMGPSAFTANMDYLRSYHGVRGIQVESTWAGLLFLWSAFSGAILTIDNIAQSFEIMGHTMIATTASLATIAGLALLFLKMIKDRSSAVTFNPAILFLPLLWALLTTPVLSPQYFVWIIPLLLIYSAEELLDDPYRLLPWALLGLTILTAALTQWIYPVLYDDLLHFRSFLAVVILNIRNGCVAVLIAMLWWSSPNDRSIKHQKKHQ